MDRWKHLDLCVSASVDFPFPEKRAVQELQWETASSVQSPAPTDLMLYEARDQQFGQQKH